MSQNNHLVSIITACYNSEKHISDMINSVLAQTYQNWELLLVDDCSTDKTLDIINTITSSESRIKVFQLTKNSGAAVARNKAIQEANGRFIAFLDSDDRWLSLKLEKQMAFMISNGYSLTHTAYEIIDEFGNISKKMIKPAEVLNYNDMLYANKIGCLTAIYDQHQLGKIEMPLLRKRQDYGLWLNILQSGIKAYGLSEVLAQYRQTENSMSSNKMDLIKWNWKLFREVQGLSVMKSMFYLLCNIASKLKR